MNGREAANLHDTKADAKLSQPGDMESGREGSRKPLTLRSAKEYSQMPKWISETESTAG